MSRFSKLKEIPVMGSIVFSIYMKLQKKIYEREHQKFVQKLEFPNGKKVFYLDVPIHANLGDLAQYLCTKKWIADNYPEYNYVEIDGLILSDTKCGIMNKLKGQVSDEDIIIFQSGYCTQDLGGYHDLVHRLVVRAFPNNLIIMLPQTVFYKDEKNARITADIYANHNLLFFMARDFTSADIAKKLFPNLDIQIYPDIVTTLIGSKNTLCNQRNGIALCIRNDSEKFYSDAEIDKLKNKLQVISSVYMCDTTIYEKFDSIKDKLNILIDNMINRFAKVKVVITDRYHGTIFSLIAGTPVIVIKTTDHKVKTGIEWFYGIYDDYVYYADTLEDAYKKAKEFLNADLKYQLNPYFKEKYYDDLKHKIDLWLKDRWRTEK